MTKLSICVAAGVLWLASLGSAPGFFNSPFPFEDACKSAAYAAVPGAPGVRITGSSIKVEKDNVYSVSVTAEAGGRSVGYRFLCSWANGDVKIIKRIAVR
jgi:hypothetical protein